MFWRYARTWTFCGAALLDEGFQPALFSGLVHIDAVFWLTVYQGAVYWNYKAISLHCETMMRSFNV